MRRQPLQQKGGVKCVRQEFVGGQGGTYPEQGKPSQMGNGPQGEGKALGTVWKGSLVESLQAPSTPRPQSGPMVVSLSRGNDRD